jgi:murein DD-endopeptidase MepM/ murein hydrolase activator NlpD
MRAARISLPLVLLAAAAALAGCIPGPTYRPVSYVTPKDPPPLPLRKPAPPSDLAGWSSAPVAPVAGITGATGVASRPPGVIDVEVQELVPQTASQPASPPQPPAAPTPQSTPAPLVTAAPVAADAIPASTSGRYRVASGDSLFGIARRFGLPIRAVIDANNLQPPYALSIGQELAVPSAQVHEVAVGDTVYSIARHYDVDRSELVRLNAIQPPYTIPVGEKLILPTPGSAVEAEPAPVDVAYTPPDAGMPDGGAPGAGAPDAGAPDAGPPAAAAPPPRPPKARSRDAVRAALANPPGRAGVFFWPVQGPVLSSYGAKSGGEHNDGINIAAPRGTPVRAAENGVVAYAGDELKGFGRLLLVKHADGWVTAYAHNEELLVAAGDTVQQGQTIATVGSSGHVDRPQLHFEVRRGSRAVNPEAQLSPRTASAAD